ncbi:MAG TPA: TetR/AcrR family transcriptional regulator [Ignavibacteria bacterium]|jgi:AcrR family transcriptional regulator
MAAEQVSEKEKILYFTHAKFITEGFYKTTMDEIARDLQISKKTIYKHFPSKEDLLQAVCDMRLDTMHEKIDEIVESNVDSIAKFLKMINLNKSMMMNCSPMWFKDLQVHAPHCLNRFNEVKEKKLMNVLSRLFEQGKKEKLVQNVPTQILIAAMIGAIDAVTHGEFILNSKYSFHDAIRITAEIFFNGILTETGKDKYANTKKLFENVLQ